MSWQHVNGHDRQQEMFQRAVERGRLGHAYLFCGPAGIGKRTFARLLAQTLLCQNRDQEHFTPCGECSGCRQMLTSSHPDFMQVGLPAGKSELPIDVFVGSKEKRGREGLCHELSLAPMHGGHRIAIIDDADRMNVASANALLKTLEEPGPGAVLILIAADADQVINTIRSRCQIVYFGSLPADELQTTIEQVWTKAGHDAIPESSWSAIMRHTSGSVRSALDWLQARESSETDSSGLMDKVLKRPRFRAADLAQTGQQILGQFGSDTNFQREAAQLILKECLTHFHHLLVAESQQSVPPAALIDAYGDAMSHCLEAEYQIERRGSVPMILDAFYHNLEKDLQSTWNSPASRS